MHHYAAALALSAVSLVLAPRGHAEEPHIPEIVTSEDTMFAQMRERASTATLEEIEREWELWLDAVKSPLGASDIRALILSKREAVAELYSRTCVTHIPAVGSEWTACHEFAQSAEKLYWSREILEPENVFSRRAYDGEVVRVLIGDPSGHVRGEIATLSDRSQFYSTDNILAQCMLVDSIRNLQRDWAPYDLATLLDRSNTVVLEDVVTIDDRPCFVAVMGLPATFRVFLDYEKDFSVVRYDEFTYRKEEGIPADRRLKATRIASDFHDYGNGLWLPARTVTRWYDDDKNVKARSEYELMEVRVNEPIPDSMFVDMFDEGVIVFDSIRGLSYSHGEDASVERAIGESVRKVVASLGSLDDEAAAALPSTKRTEYGLLQEHDVLVVLGTLLGIGLLVLGRQWIRRRRQLGRQ